MYPRRHCRFFDEFYTFCTSECSSAGEYCKNHACPAEDCENPIREVGSVMTDDREQPNKYCGKCTCAGCGKLASHPYKEDSNFCSNCECKFGCCEKGTEDGQECCEEHTCCDDGCKNPVYSRVASSRCHHLDRCKDHSTKADIDKVDDRVDIDDKLTCLDLN